MSSNEPHFNKFPFAWGKRTYVMGIVNATPDSFSGDGRMDVQEAIEAPRWSTRGFASSVFPHNMSHPGDLSVESRIPDSVQKALQAKGHKLQSAGAWSLGSNAAIAIDPKTGVLSAGADPRVEAYAWAR